MSQDLINAHPDTPAFRTKKFDYDGTVFSEITISGNATFASVYTPSLNAAAIKTPSSFNSISFIKSEQYGQSLKLNAGETYISESKNFNHTMSNNAMIKATLKKLNASDNLPASVIIDGRMDQDGNPYYVITNAGSAAVNVYIGVTLTAIDFS